MSHLQPNFIAKAKAKHQRSSVVREMPRSMRMGEATFVPTPRYNPKKNRKNDDPFFGTWMWYEGAYIPYLQFTLKKGK